ncbi:hypothetical protein [Nevskia sp.]|uniref:hypothetical protein n=1 Tax=Nevskia sp. TaxID=1929292 RepID=UPI0025F6B60F|nr:hypothetical protein [Nevskia sp.]
MTSKEPLREDAGLSLLAKAFVPDLPSGMSVEGCVAVVFECHSETEFCGFSYECAWVDQTVACTGPETGEALEALGWDNGTHMVLVGTEDEEFLSARLSTPIAFAKGNFDVEYKNNGLAICFARFPARSSLVLHFVIAWNRSPEPSACSCWYAVSTPHRQCAALTRGSSSEVP